MNTYTNSPKVKEVKPINFLFHRTTTKVDELIHQIPVAKALFKEAVRLDLHPCGPVHWHYIGFTGDPAQTFTLEVCLPVDAVPATYDGDFHFKRTETYKSVSLLHEGPWTEIPKSYDTLMKYVQMQRFIPSGVARELYINADFKNPEANVTEIQLGIQ